LIPFLSKLSEQEIKEFRISYMNKLYRNSTKSRLLNYLQKYHPHFPKEKLDAEKIHQRIFKNNSYNRDNVINAFSDLRKELRRFLIWKYQEDFPFERNIMLLQLYEKHNLKSHFNLQLKSMKTEVEKEKMNTWKEYKKMRIAHEYYFDPQKIQINLSADSLKEANDSLDKFYFISKLKYACELQNRNQVLQKGFPKIKFLDKITHEPKEAFSVLYQCFFLNYKLLQERDEAVYLELKKLVFENIKNFSRRNQHIFLTYLINHNSYKKRLGLSFSKKELFELYQFGVTYEIFIVDGVFNDSHFNNIVNLACKLKELKWLDQFIKRWSTLLKEDIKEHTILLSKAFICFEKKEYEKVIRLIGSIEFKGVHNKIRFRCLQIAGEFEINEDHQYVIHLCTLCEKFAKRNNEIGTTMKQGLFNFAKIVKKIISFPNQKNKINTEFKKGEFIYFEDWLKEKTNLL